MCVTVFGAMQRQRDTKNQVHQIIRPYCLLIITVFIAKLLPPGIYIFVWNPLISFQLAGTSLIQQVGSVCRMSKVHIWGLHYSVSFFGPIVRSLYRHLSSPVLFKLILFSATLSSVARMLTRSSVSLRLLCSSLVVEITYIHT